MGQLVSGEKMALALPLTDHQRARLITTLWTFKEGYTKAIGEGVGFGLERIAVDLSIDGLVDGVSVDGRDIRWDGWKWTTGWVGDGKEYGWSVYWKGDPDFDKPQHVYWDEFVQTLLA